MSINTSSNDSHTPGHGYGVEIVAFETNPTSSEADGSGRHLQGDVFDNTLPFGNDDDAVAEDEEGDTSNQVTKSNSFFGISRTVGGAMTGLFFFAMTAGTVWVVKDNRSSMVSNSAVVVSPATAKAKATKAPVAKVTKTPKAPGGLTPSESAKPSSGPSLSPSGQPSSMPSGSPSSSSEPSSQPSLAPSESAKPSSGPSLSPSGQPSSIPSGGGGCDPTVPLSCYEEVGAGFCTNIDDMFFNYVFFSMLPTATASDCASKCGECVKGSIAGGSFRGFSFGPGNPFGAKPAACSCFFDDGGSWNKPSTCSELDINLCNGGTGVVTGATIPLEPQLWSYSCYSVVE